MYKKRVAICISGHMREYKKLKSKFYSNFIECNPDYDFDIFISTWNTKNTVISHAYQRRNYENFELLDINEIIEHYNPVDIIFEENNDELFSKFDYIRGVNITRAVISQFYKINQVGNLMINYSENNNIRYDYIVRIRPDVFFREPVILDKLDMSLINLEYDDVGLRPDGTVSAFGSPGWISDKMLIMDIEKFKVFIEIYNKFENLVNKTGHNIPEILIYRHFLDNNLPYIKLNELNISWV